MDCDLVLCYNLTLLLNEGCLLMRDVVLFDFHNTLVKCDGWLDLEIRTLPGLVLGWLAADGLVESPSTDMISKASDLFRDLRTGVHKSGREISAADGAAQVLAQLGYQVALADVQHAVECLEDSLLPGVEMMPGAEDALKRLRDAGCSLGVISSAGFPPFVELALEELGLRTFFSEVITSAGVGIYKSDPEIYRLAVSRLGAIPSESVHVGDHPIFDIKAAKAAGLATIWFAAESASTGALRGEMNWRSQEGDEMTAMTEADATICSLDELFEAVQSLS